MSNQTEHDKTPYLLWLDLETTGTDEDRDYIIEFAGILTTSDTLEEIDRWESPVHPWNAEPRGGLGTRAMALSKGVDDFIIKMHDANGLWDDLDHAAATPEELDSEVRSWLRRHHAHAHRTAIAGSGVAHFDMRFIQAQMPKLAKEVRYWQIDVGVLRRANALWGGPGIATRNEDKPHRAMADAEIHLADARAWREFLIDASCGFVEPIT